MTRLQENVEAEAQHERRRATAKAVRECETLARQLILRDDFSYEALLVLVTRLPHVRNARIPCNQGRSV